MRYILNFAYLLLFAIYLPVLYWQKYFRGKSRPGIGDKFFGVVAGRSGSSQTTVKSCVVFHAVSLGEVNAIRKLVSQYKEAHPHKEVVVSTTTQTGLEAAKKAFPGLTVCLLPFDFTWAVRRFLNTLSPELLVLAELEIWPNLLAECRRRGIQTCLVNGRLTEKSHRKYRRLSFVFRPVFANFDLVCVQHAEYSRRFESLGVPRERIRIPGNLKYDSLLLSRDEPQSRSFRRLLNIENSEVVFLAGSTQAPEESIAIEAYLRLESKYPQLRLMICPRHPERFNEVADLLNASKLEFSRRSELNESAPNHVSRVVLIDSVGELRYWWTVADLAFVGGSFGNRGGQNMLEPAALGAAVCFGPNTHNFSQEVEWLTNENAAVQLQQQVDLTDFLGRCLEDQDYQKLLGRNARALFLNHANSDTPVWEKTINAIREIDPSTAQTERPSKAA